MRLDSSLSIAAKCAVGPSSSERSLLFNPFLCHPHSVGILSPHLSNSVHLEDKTCKWPHVYWKVDKLEISSISIKPRFNERRLDSVLS